VDLRAQVQRRFAVTVHERTIGNGCAGAS